MSDRNINAVLIRDVRKTEIRFGFGFKNRTVQKFDIRSDGFPTELRANPQFMLKVTKITLLAFKCAHKERFKHYRN